MILTILGHVPGKKNVYSQRRDGRRFRNREILRQEADIIRQIVLQAGNLEPMIHPCIKAHFICADARPDLDNKWTCLQDCLVKSGLLISDNLAHLKGPITFSGEVGPDERVIVEIG